MKKIITMLVLCLTVITIAACGNLNDAYHDNAEIARTGDSNSTRGARSSTIGNELTVSTTGMTGTRTIWRYTANSEVDVTFSYSLSVNGGGKAKLVLIAPDGEVIILAENTDNTTNREMQSQTITLRRGNNRVKIVGFDAPAFDLKLTVNVGRVNW